MNIIKNKIRKFSYHNLNLNVIMNSCRVYFENKIDNLYIVTIVGFQNTSRFYLNNI